MNPLLASAITFDSDTVWTIVGILAVVALVLWILSFVFSRRAR